MSPIGSSGLDGVRSSFGFDSFFDVTVEADFKGRTIQTEMVALSLSDTINQGSNPGDILDDVRRLLGDDNKVFYGHVAVLK